MSTVVLHRTLPIRTLAAAVVLAASLTVLAGNAPAELPREKEHIMESAKRRPPLAKPVIAKGIRYEQLRRPEEHGFTQSGGVIAAVDTKTDKMLWTVQLYQTEFDSLEERDAQEVYVKELALDRSGHALLATDERKRVWSVDLATRAVTAVGAQR